MIIIIIIIIIIALNADTSRAEGDKQGKIASAVKAVPIRTARRGAGRYLLGVTLTFFVYDEYKSRSG